MTRFERPRRRRGSNVPLLGCGRDWSNGLCFYESYALRRERILVGDWLI